MADLLYLRHSTDSQTDARQRHALAPLLAAGAPVFEDPATSSRVLSMDRPGFKRLLDAAAVGDTIRIADAARLFRSVSDVLALRPVLIRRGLHLKVASGLLSGIDLAADDPGTKMVVSVLAAVLEFQRDMISENTKEGVAAAAASGKTLGRPTSLSEDQTAEVLKAYRGGAAVKALARQHQVDPKTIRRVLDSAGARTVPDDLDKPSPPPQDLTRIEHQEQRTAPPEPLVSIDVPGLLADHLRDSANTEIREMLRAGRTVRRGQGFSLRVTAPLSTHQTALHLCTALAGGPGADSTSAARKAYRVYSDRIDAAAAAGTPPAPHRMAPTPPAPDRTAPDLTAPPASTPSAVQPAKASQDPRKDTAPRRKRLTKKAATAILETAELVKHPDRESNRWILRSGDTVLGHIEPTYGGTSRSGRNGWTSIAEGGLARGPRRSTREEAMIDLAGSWIRIITAPTRRTLTGP